MRGGNHYQSECQHKNNDNDRTGNTNATDNNNKLEQSAGDKNTGSANDNSTLGTATSTELSTATVVGTTNVTSGATTED